MVMNVFYKNLKYFFRRDILDMKLYLKEISKYNILAPEEEEKLWNNYKNKGCSDSRQELIKSYQPLVFKIVKQLCSNKEIVMDLIQEGNVGLIDAVDSFDPERGTKFLSFAVYHIRGRVLDYLKTGTSLLLDKEQIYHDYLEEAVESKYALDKIKTIISELPLKEKAIIEGIYLADKKADLLAAEMGISLSYLYRLQKKGIRRLRGKLSNFMKNWK